MIDQPKLSESEPNPFKPYQPKVNQVILNQFESNKKKPKSIQTKLIKPIQSQINFNQVKLALNQDQLKPKQSNAGQANSKGVNHKQINSNLFKLQESTQVKPI